MSSPSIFGESQSFRVETNGRDGKVLVDGHDISKAVRGLRIDVEAGYPMEVTLDLVVLKASEIDSEGAKIAMPEATERLLIEAGWTPPAVPDNAAQSAVQEGLDSRG